MVTQSQEEIEQRLRDFLIQQGQLVDDTIEVDVIGNILKSLTSLGYDVTSNYDKLISILNVLIAHNEWDSLHSVAVMKALADGFISDAEITAIFSVNSAEDTVDSVTKDLVIAGTTSVDGVNITVQVLIDDAVAETERHFRDLIDKLMLLLEEEQAERIYLQEVLAGGWTAELGHFGRRITDDIGRRLETWIANAMGIERTE